jgi:hypothetical protein
MLMEMNETPKAKRRWYRPTPAWLVIGSLVVTGFLFLSERFGWFSFNEHKGYAVLIAVASVGVVMLAMLLWFAVAPLFRWRFQFSIRTLLLLAVAVALPCSWLAVEMKEAREQKEAVAQIEGLGGSVNYDSEMEELSGPDVPDFLLRLLGADFFDYPAFVFLYDEAQMEPLKRLSRIETLALYHDKITDVSLHQLKGLKQVQSLVLYNTLVTDEGLTDVAELSQLESLSFRPIVVGILPPPDEVRRPRITDAGLSHLARATRLQWLDLAGTDVTDAGLESLKALTKLEKLDVYDTHVTAEGVKRLKQALPTCEITRGTPTPHN